MGIQFNLAQRIVLRLGAVALVALAAFPPWVRYWPHSEWVHTWYGHAWAFNPPGPAVLHWKVWGLEAVALGLLCVLGIMVAEWDSHG